MNQEGNLSMRAALLDEMDLLAVDHTIIALAFLHDVPPSLTAALCAILGRNSILAYHRSR